MTSFLTAPSPRIPRHTGIHAPLLFGSISLLAHVVVVMVVIGLFRSSGMRDLAVQEPQRATPAPIDTARLVFLATPRQAGPAGGGGGGGNRQPAPIRRAEAPGTDSVTLPVAPPIVASAQPMDEPALPQVVLLAAKPLTSGLAFQVGSLDGTAVVGTSRGPGDGSGAGEGVGSGMGSGRGPGIGPGAGGGIGGETYRVGNGVTPPTVLLQVKPAYTANALRSKIQGSVLLELVVQRDGTPRDIRITRSLDPYGLDLEAIHALEQWRFGPGRFNGVPVDVRVTVQLDFSIQ